MAEKVATLTEVKEFFGYANLSAFSPDWKALSKDEQTAIRAGIGNGSLNY